MNKKGFISTAVIYSFFLVFIAIVLSIVVAYSNRRVLLSTIKNDARDILDNHTSYDCFSKGITNLGDCIIETNGGKDSILALSNTVFISSPEDGLGGLYKTVDNGGDTYYFRGDVTNNYLQFGIYEQTLFKGYTITLSESTDPATGETIQETTISDIEDFSSSGECSAKYPSDENTDTLINVCEKIYEEGDKMYWRIVRINSDGTIRLIYDGTSLQENKNSANSGYSNPSDIFGNIFDMIASLNKLTDKFTEGYIKSDYTSINSTLDEWYNMHIGEYYKYYTKESDYCLENDYFDYNSSTPPLFCDTSSSVTSRVGLLSADEAIIAGAAPDAEEVSHYLYTKFSYHLMTPSSNTNQNYIVSLNGIVELTENSAEYNLRPVINLASYVKIKNGDGTIDNPYVLEEVGY